MFQIFLTALGLFCSQDLSFSLGHMGPFSCGSQDLPPWLGMEPGSYALGGQHLRHWTTREVPLRGKLYYSWLLRFFFFLLFCLPLKRREVNFNTPRFPFCLCHLLGKDLSRLLNFSKPLSVNNRFHNQLGEIIWLFVLHKVQSAIEV